MTPQILGVAEAAEYCGLSRATLYNYRHTNRGPDSFRDGGRVRYYSDVLDAWNAERLRKKAERLEKRAA
jgi:predicted DNA-binding transcriptional regulator AlpA